MTFRAVSCPSNKLTCWDDEFLVFDARSGATHLLSACAGRLLLQLRHAAGLAPAIPASEPAPGAQFDMVDMEQILADLESLALIERA